MRIVIGLLILAAGSSCTRPSPDAVAQAGTAREPIFREISFSPFQPMELGARIPEGAPPTRMIAPGLLAVARPHFGGTDSIYIEVDAGQRIAAFHFVYPARQVFSESIAEYVQTLGMPQRVSLDSAGGQLERAVWTDGATHFELSELTVGATRHRMWSSLRNRRPH